MIDTWTGSGNEVWKTGYSSEEWRQTRRAVEDTQKDLGVQVTRSEILRIDALENGSWAGPVDRPETPDVDNLKQFFADNCTEGIAA